MKKILCVIVTVGIMVFACEKKDHSQSKDEISGTYVREYSFKVVNPETYGEVGMRTVRDSILIKSIDEKYEISNHKWRLNDYDHEGWQNMEHAEDRSMQTFQATFNSTDGSLDAESRLHLFLDFKRRQLFKDESRDKPYQKLR